MDPFENLLKVLDPSMEKFTYASTTLSFLHNRRDILRLLETYLCLTIYGSVDSGGHFFPEFLLLRIE